MLLFYSTILVDELNNASDNDAGDDDGEDNGDGDGDVPGWPGSQSMHLSSLSSSLLSHPGPMHNHSEIKQRQNLLFCFFDNFRRAPFRNRCHDVA